jgi:hypothetical protein
MGQKDKKRMFYSTNIEHLLCSGHCFRKCRYVSEKKQEKNSDLIEKEKSNFSLVKVTVNYIHTQVSIFNSLS